MGLSSSSLFSKYGKVSLDFLTEMRVLFIIPFKILMCLNLLIYEIFKNIKPGQILPLLLSTESAPSSMLEKNLAKRSFEGNC